MWGKVWKPCLGGLWLRLGLGVRVRVYFLDKVTSRVGGSVGITPNIEPHTHMVLKTVPSGLFFFIELSKDSRSCSTTPTSPSAVAQKRGWNQISSAKTSQASNHWTTRTNTTGRGETTAPYKRACGATTTCGTGAYPVGCYGRCSQTLLLERPKPT